MGDYDPTEQLPTLLETNNNEGKTRMESYITIRYNLVCIYSKLVLCEYAYVFSLDNSPKLFAPVFC